jgi:hypothetical protein
MKSAQVATRKASSSTCINLCALAESWQLLADLLEIDVRLLLCREHVYVVELWISHSTRPSCFPESTTLAHELKSE